MKSEPPSPKPHAAPAGGSPFVVGRPLRPDDPIFGRDEAFRFIEGELREFNSVNVVGERRMGKTSLLNHLCSRRAPPAPKPGAPPLCLARFDLQEGVSHASRFYGTALREILSHLPPGRGAENRALAELGRRLVKRPEADYDEFRQVLAGLREGKGVRPVVVVDEFELLLEPSAREGFPYPQFYNGVRALITADLLAMLVASRRPLAEYFSDPKRPASLTSTFPNYFQPFVLRPLDDAAADALLLQPSDHPLSNAEAADARLWAAGHPCHLQVAGAAWYQAKSEARLQNWTPEQTRARAYARREELKSQNCLTGLLAQHEQRTRPHLARRAWAALHRAARALFIGLPTRVGRLILSLGENLDKLAAWFFGFVLIIFILLLIVGQATGSDLLTMLKNWFAGWWAEPPTPPPPNP